MIRQVLHGFCSLPKVATIQHCVASQAATADVGPMQTGCSDCLGAILSFLHWLSLILSKLTWLYGLHVQELKPKTKIGISGQFDATNPNTKPKVGFAFDLKN